MGKKSRFLYILWSTAFCILLVLSFTSFIGLAQAAPSSKAQWEEEDRLREKKGDTEALKEARETQQSFPKAYRTVCTPAALSGQRRLEQYYQHLAPKTFFGKALSGLEVPASKAADGYAYGPDSRYARLLHLLRSYPLTLGEPGTKAVLEVLFKLAKVESWIEAGRDDDRVTKSNGKNACAHFAALLSDAELFMNAPGNSPVNIAISARIMEGAFADADNLINTSPLWENCGDEALHSKVADLLVLSQKKAFAEQDDNHYGAGLRYDPLMRAYHTVMTRIADPERQAAWYAESVAYYHEGKLFTGSGLQESLHWLLRFEPTGTYEAGKKILDDFNERYRDVRNAGIWGGPTGNLYDAFPSYRFAYYYLYAKTGDERALEAMLAAVFANGPAMERNRLYFEAEVSLLLGQYKKGLILFARYASEKGSRDEMHFINSNENSFPGYDVARSLSYRIWEGYGDRRKLEEKQTDSLKELLVDYKTSLLAECLDRWREGRPLTRAEEACAQGLVTRMNIR